ncbi:hypothetical protein [Pseudoalteromonas aurantia]|uniref:Uncharacterized protein n=1 Tax=Pseudoalteromonas aurantia TaxID=43654 RepID=A0ABY2VRZ0_9GAMM|nr:hypothetical protein [Pseudoalteromonas aurantia]TMO57601.1 hypothetical protein CWC18_18490 [Pseudoalteromonas aurantia]TMO69128.1 hypothetical protein CWC20_20985 [Pseudoalteromonas aurantia]
MNLPLKILIKIFTIFSFLLSTTINATSFEFQKQCIAESDDSNISYKQLYQHPLIEKKNLALFGRICQNSEQTAQQGVVS